MKKISTCTFQAPTRINDTEPQSDWPTEGEVAFQNYTTRYRPGLDLVLRGVHCTVSPGEKVRHDMFKCRWTMEAGLCITSQINFPVLEELLHHQLGYTICILTCINLCYVF